MIWVSTKTEDVIKNSVIVEYDVPRSMTPEEFVQLLNEDPQKAKKRARQETRRRKRKLSKGTESPVGVYNPDAILADPNANPIHKMYAEINIGVRDRGERWEKCINCGQPYQLTEQWDNSVVCSEVCSDEADNDFLDF